MSIETVFLTEEKQVVSVRVEDIPWPYALSKVTGLQASSVSPLFLRPTRVSICSWRWYKEPGYLVPYLAWRANRYTRSPLDSLFTKITLRSKPQILQWFNSCIFCPSTVVKLLVWLRYSEFTLRICLSAYIFYNPSDSIFVTRPDNCTFSKTYFWITNQTK